MDDDRPHDRPTVYAAITRVLRADPRLYGSQAIFNQALTFALVEIGIAEELPDFADGVDSMNRVPAASALLTKLRHKLNEEDVDTLKTAVRETDKVRHGRDRPRYLTPHEVDALARLDEHPALRALSLAEANERDEEWVREQAIEAMEQERAYSYLELLDWEETERRLRALPVGHHHDDPDSNLAQECPVCEHTALITTGSDDYGYGVGSGHCFVCSYHRSWAAANEQGYDLEMARLMSKD